LARLIEQSSPIAASQNHNKLMAANNVPQPEFSS
jgi:hypothetical protein